MGLDLDFIAQGRQRPLGRDYRVFCQLSPVFRDIGEQTIFPQEFPEGHPSHGMEDGYGTVSFVPAVEIKQKLRLPPNASQSNRDVLAWVSTLPDSEEVILYWH